MNYQQYLEVKTNCEKKIKIYSVSIYLTTFLAVVQSILLIIKIDIHFPYLNLLILDQLFSMGYSKIAEGNTVFGAAFYAAFGFVILCFLVASLYCPRRRRFPYLIVIFYYSVDALLCVMTLSFIQLAVHVFFLIFVVAGYRNRNYLIMLKNNIWGYK